MSNSKNSREINISKKAGKAIMDYAMLSDGDRIAVGVSGGKDSLCLLRILHSRQAFCPIKYHLVAVHVDLGTDKSELKKLEAYFKKLEYDYVIKKLKLPFEKKSRRLDKENKSCFWCSWNRRKILFETAAEYRCNKVALGHHLDDIVQTILLNMFFNGEISAMSPKQELFKGRLTIIRPLAYIPENRIAHFVRKEELPYFNSKCPNALLSNRKKVADVIRKMEKLCPGVKTNIFRSIKRIKKDYLL